MGRDAPITSPPNHARRPGVRRGSRWKPYTHKGDNMSEQPIDKSASEPAKSDDIRWAVNVLLEKIAAKFEANETLDIWKSDAAALVRSFKHPL